MEKFLQNLLKVGFEEFRPPRKNWQELTFLKKHLEKVYCVVHSDLLV